ASVRGPGDCLAGRLPPLVTFPATASSAGAGTARCLAPSRRRSGCGHVGATWRRRRLERLPARRLPPAAGRLWLAARHQQAPLGPSQLERCRAMAGGSVIGAVAAMDDRPGSIVRRAGGAGAVATGRCTGGRTATALAPSLAVPEPAVALAPSLGRP